MHKGEDAEEVPRAVVAAGTCSSYGGIHAMEGNPTGAMGLCDYLGWAWRSKADIPVPWSGTDRGRRHRARPCLFEVDDHGDGRNPRGGEHRRHLEHVLGRSATRAGRIRDKPQIAQISQMTACCLNGLFIFRPAPHLIEETIKQPGFFHRFDQVSLDPRLGQFRGTYRVIDGGEQDQSRAEDNRVGLDRRRQGKAVHSRHLDIQECNIVWLPFLGRGSQSVKRFLAAGGAPHFHFPRRHLVAEDLTVYQFIVHHQDPHRQPVATAGVLRYKRLSLLLHLRGEPKSGSFARFAADAYFTFHQGHQLHGDGQAQASAAILAGHGTIGLAESLKEASLGLERNADPAVFYLKANPGLRRGFTPVRNPNDHFPFGGEFQSITDQVGQDLPQSPRIPAQPRWHVRGDRDGQLNPFGVSAFDQHFQGAFDRFDQIKVEDFEDQFADLDFGEIQNVIDNIHEGIGAGVNNLDELALLGVQIGVEQQN
jgi:hypothetical protein